MGNVGERSVIDQHEKEWRAIRNKRGSELEWSKLNEKLVKKIRERHAMKMEQIDRLNREHSAVAMAKEFQVSVGAIEKALSRQTWKHV